MKKSNPVIIIASFIAGLITMLLIANIFNYKELKVQKNTCQNESISTSIEKIYDAVVTIQNYKDLSVATTGTGFIYKKDNKYGYILTNEHVIRDNDKINIILSNDKEVEGTLLGKDEYLDLAVIKINKKYVSKVATLGKSKEIKLGDTIFTIGSPLGYDYRGSVTVGVLSGKDRKVKTTASAEEDWIMKVLQIDAPINHGNSGGPLLNANGEVIGICTLKLVEDDVEGMGFAIPIEYALNYIDTLESSERIKWPSLGIRIVNIDESATIASKDITIPDDVEDGVVITKVNDNSPLKTGDIIIEINKQKIKDIAEFKYELYQFKENDTIEIKYIRDGKTKTAKIKLKSSN